MTNNNTIKMNSTDFVRRVVRNVAPSHYVHIGAPQRLLEIIKRGRAICVDPHQKNITELSQHGRTYSVNENFEQYFLSSHASKWFSDVEIGIGFIDGLHFCQNVMNDFYNIESKIGANGLIFIDLALPTSAILASEEFIPGRPWTGDVWKAIAALKELRPNLLVNVFTTEAFGLAAISNLDPSFSPDAAATTALFSQLHYESYDWLLSLFKAQSVTEDTIHALIQKTLAPRNDGNNFSDNWAYQINSESNAFEHWRTPAPVRAGYNSTITEEKDYSRPACSIFYPDDLRPEWRHIISRFSRSEIATSPEIKALYIPHAQLLGRGIVITPDQQVIDETLTPFYHRLVSPDLLYISPNRKFCTPDVGISSRKIYGEAVILKSYAAENYGHWLVETLPRLLMIEKVRGTAEITAIVSPAKSTVYRKMISDSINLFSNGRAHCLEVTDQEIVYCEGAWLTTPIAWHPDIKSPLSIRLIEERVSELKSKGVLQQRDDSKIVYVSRKFSAVRRLKNEDKITDIIIKNGGTVIYPEELTLIDQISIFSSASVIVGVMGAGLTNIIFSPATAKVLALAPGTMSDPFFWDLASLKSQSYSCIYGLPENYENIQNCDFTVDENVFAHTLDHLLNQYSNEVTHSG